MNLLQALWTHGRAGGGGKKGRRVQKENFASVALAAVLNQDADAREEVLKLFGVESAAATRLDLQRSLRTRKGKYIGQPDLVVEHAAGESSEIFVLEVKWDAGVDPAQLAKYAKGDGVREVWLLSREPSDRHDGPAATWGQVVQALRRVSLRAAGTHGGLRDDLAELLVSEDFGAVLPAPLEAVDRDELAKHGAALAAAAGVVRGATDLLVRPTIESETVFTEPDGLLDFSVALPKGARRGSVRAAGLELELADGANGLDWSLWVCLRKREAERAKKRLKKAGWVRADTDGEGGRWLWVTVDSPSDPSEGLAVSATRAIIVARRVLGQDKLTSKFGERVGGGPVPTAEITVGQVARALTATDLGTSILEQVLVVWRDHVLAVLGENHWTGHVGPKEGVYLKSRHLGRHYRCYFELFMPIASLGIPAGVVGRLCWKLGVWHSGRWSPSDLADALPNCGWTRVTPENPLGLYLMRPVDGDGPDSAASEPLWAALHGWFEDGKR